MRSPDGGRTASLLARRAAEYDCQRLMMKVVGDAETYYCYGDRRYRYAARNHWDIYRHGLLIARNV